MAAVTEASPFMLASGPRNESHRANIPGPELSVIVPTRNEDDNVRPVYDALCRALENIDWEVIFVDDDSQDGTPEAICRLARLDRRVRSIQVVAGLLPPVSKEF
jgi:dolichol-phosphate mannosyltransferase